MKPCLILNYLEANSGYTTVVFNPIVRTFYVQVGKDVSTLFDSDIGTILEQVAGVAFKHRHVQTLAT